MSVVRPSHRLVFNVHVTSLFLNSENRIVSRRHGSNADCAGYVFTNRPLVIGESIIVRIHSISEQSKGVLGFGMTSCDPSLLVVQGLPDDCDLLYDRPEYWVIEKARFADLNSGDELDFHFVESADGSGEIKFAKNDQKTPVSLMFLDKTVPLWVFFELGNIREMKILESSSSYHLPSSNDSITSMNLTSRGFTSDIPRTQSNNSPSLPQSPKRSKSSPTPVLQERKTEVPSRPNPPPIPPRPSSIKQTPRTMSSQFSPTPFVVAVKGQVNQLVEKLNLKTGAVDRIVGNQRKREAPPPPVASQNVGSRGAQKTTSSDNECAVCMEGEVDCVLYTCGHMCLCYACAIELKKRTNSECPICRKTISDVIRTFKA